MELLRGQFARKFIISNRIINLTLIKIFLVDIYLSQCYVHLMDYARNGNIQRQRILDMHNMLRSYEAGGAWGKGAVYMLRLTYDTGLESYAKNYATKLCQTGHWGHSKKLPPNRVAPGENLYVNTIDYSNKSPLDFDPSVVVKKWWDERKYFDWNSSDPSAKAKKMGQLIGHYTQVVRAEASAVGCWIVTGCQCKSGLGCSKENNPPYWSTYMACHYDFGNVGWFPYWPLAFPHRIPRSIRSENRKRCGNCPKGFSVCGTTGGYLNPKRDAYLCVGFWDKNKRLPPSNLLEKSIKARHSKNGLPSWIYMIRHCHNNGGCPVSGAGSKCWEYKNYLKEKKEPKIIFQQCLCNNFKTSQGTWFQRDACLSSNTNMNSQPLTRYGVLSLKDFISSRYNGLKKGKIMRKRMGQKGTFPKLKWDAIPEVGLKDFSTQLDMKDKVPIFKYNNLSDGENFTFSFSNGNKQKDQAQGMDILSLENYQIPEPGIENILLEMKSGGNKKKFTNFLFTKLASKVMPHDKRSQIINQSKLVGKNLKTSNLKRSQSSVENSVDNSQMQGSRVSPRNSLASLKSEIHRISSDYVLKNSRSGKIPAILKMAILKDSQGRPRPDENITLTEIANDPDFKISQKGDDPTATVIQSDPIAIEDIPKQLEVEQDLTSSEPIIDWLVNGSKQIKNNNKKL